MMPNVFSKLYDFITESLFPLRNVNGADSYTERKQLLSVSHSSYVPKG